MLFEFVDSFKGISIGDKIMVKDSCIPPLWVGSISAPNAFLEYINQLENCFTVRSMQKIGDGNAMVGVEEINECIELYQIEPYKRRRPTRLVNSGRVDAG